MLSHAYTPEPSGAPRCRQGARHQGAWVEGALRRLNVTLCKGNDFLFRANLHALCRRW